MRTNYFNKVVDVIRAIFRQHQWENVEHEFWNITMEGTRCKRCGDVMPIPMRYVDIGWWRGGCGGEKQLIIRELEKGNGK